MRRLYHAARVPGERIGGRSDASATSRSTNVWARLARVLGLLGATETLTPREREVVRALLKGHAEAEIAELVGMTTRSAHQRIVGIYRKLGVRTQAELTALVLDGASGPTGT